MMKYLVSGGTGRLAFELKKHLVGTYVGIEHWDFTYDIQEDPSKYDLVLHMGAYTDVRKAETERDKCFDTNVKGTWKMVEKFKNIPFVYISTEYAKNPLGVYALTKRLGEEAVKHHPCHLILRTSFKPNLFPFEYAYEDQYTQGDYVDVIAKILAERVAGWDRITAGIEYLGTGRKTMFELAQRTRPDVKPNRVSDYNRKIGMELIPTDYL